jgi:hypothetical protein
MANKTKLKENNKARRDLIRDGEQRLLRRDKTLQRSLFRAIINSFTRLDIDNGFVANTTANIDKWNELQIVDNFFKDRGTPEILKTFRFVFGRLDTQASRFFSSFDIPTFEQDKQVVGLKMQQVRRTFLDGISKDTSLQRRINSRVLAGIMGNLSIEEFRNDLRETIEGTEKKLGIIENHHFVQTKANEEFVTYDRAVNDSYSSRMNLNYAVYQGGRIKTSREFCLDRNGGVFTREEILSWQQLDWQGKKDNHNIMLDCGGYNCRHYYDWVSFELAKQLRPSIQKSVFDR